MGKVIAARDWSASALGPIESWPQSLRTTVSLCLASNSPMSLTWGSKCTQIYNDAFRHICGKKHPHSLGQDFRECWASVWHLIGPAFESAQMGQTCYIENQRMFLDRNGYKEEAFFTFSFSPIRQKGVVQGLFHPFTETTKGSLSDRRAEALRDLSFSMQGCDSVKAVCDAVVEVLGWCKADVPFALIYLSDDEGKTLRLAGSAGVEPDKLPGASLIRLDEPSAPGNTVGKGFAGAMAANEPLVMERLSGCFAACSRGPYREPPSKAIVLPISRTGLIVAGISSRLPLDLAYRNFYYLMASQVAMAIARALAHEEQERYFEAVKRQMSLFDSALSKTERGLQLVLETAPCPMVMIGADARMALANARAERLFGYDRGALLGEPLAMLVAARYHAELAAFTRLSAETSGTGPAPPTGGNREMFAVCRDGSEVAVEIEINPIVVAGGPCWLASIIDVTARERARQAREDLVARLEIARAEKTVLLQEVHHRVRNNMAVISGLLGAQAAAVEEGGAKLSLTQSQQRIHSMALIHDHLYDSENLDRVNFGQYAERLAHELSSAYATNSGPISLRIEAEEIDLPLDCAVPCGLILNELVTNALKHAFPGRRAGEIGIHFARLQAGGLLLSCWDDGIGIPEGIDWQNPSSLGLQIVRILTKQIGGKLSLVRTGGKTAIEIRFPGAPRSESAIRHRTLREA